MADERLSLRPRHELGMIALVTTESPREKPSEASPEARIDPRHTPRLALARQVDLARR